MYDFGVFATRFVDGDRDRVKALVNADSAPEVDRQLAEAILDAARSAGYGCVLLDTLDDMESARALYEDLGFAEVPPYYHNPVAGAHYLKVDL